MIDIIYSFCRGEIDLQTCLDLCEKKMNELCEEEIKERMKNE